MWKIIAAGVNRNIQVAIRSLWIAAASALIACSPSAVVSSPSPPMPPTVPPLPPAMQLFSGVRIVTAVEGPDNCLSSGIWALLHSGHPVATGAFQLWRSGSDIALHAVYPTDDGTWSNYVDYSGIIDGQTFTITVPVSAATSPSCVNGSEESGTLSESLTGTLSEDGRHIKATSARTFHFPWGDVVADWEWTLNQPS